MTDSELPKSPAVLWEMKKEIDRQKEQNKEQIVKIDHEIS